MPDPVHEAASIEKKPEPDEPVADHRLESVAIVSGVYVGVATWMYLAWYYNKPTIPKWKFGGDGWFGDKTYAGGEDKFGHFWGDYTFARLGTKVFRHSGFGKVTSSLLSSGMSLTAFVLVEVKDGFFYEFSPSDLSGDIAGSVLAVVMDNWPALDDAFDARVEWFPSVGFRRSPGADFVEDYSGQRYLFAYKPRSIDAVRMSDGPLHYLAYLDPVVGIESRNYKPLPPPGEMVARRQEIFIGVSLDMQAVIDDLFEHGTSRGAHVAHDVGHTFFEFANLPFTSSPVVSYNHSPDVPDYFGAFR